MSEPTPYQAEGLVAEALAVEAALQQALERAQKLTRTLATLTAARPPEVDAEGEGEPRDG